MNLVKRTQLAEALAKGIMAAGDEPSSPCKRIQFMGGTYGINERNQGGFIETALANHVEKLLKKELKP